MSDDDLKNVLVVIDAKNNLKTLKLTGCGGILGLGLKPLKRSTVLERIDLSRAESYTKPVIGMHTTMNLNTILPILYSIVNKTGNLKHIQLPLRWRMEKQSALKEFMDTYNLHLINDANLSCSMTRRSLDEAVIDRLSYQNNALICGNEVEGARLKRGKKKFGIQSSTCYNCLAFACSDHEECKRMIDYCGNCQKNYCGGCVEVWRCHKCKKSSCVKCEERDSYCSTCGRETCGACAEDNVGHCYECDEKLCIHCGYINLMISNCTSIECQHCPQLHKLCQLCAS